MDLKFLRRLQTLVAIFYLPHELAHYLAIVRWSPNAEIHLRVPREKWPHRFMPALAEVTGDIASETRLFKIQFAAIAPAIVFPLIAVIGIEMGIVQRLATSAGYVTIVAVMAVWASPSGLDLYTFTHPREARDAGRFDAEYADPGVFYQLWAGLLAVSIFVILWLYPFLRPLII